jgi:hypothetical protein
LVFVGGPESEVKLGVGRESGSDLKIAFAWAFGRALGVACRLALKVLDFLEHLVEPLPEFFGFDFHTHLAVLTHEMGLGALFELADQERVLVTALGAGDINCIVFEHP